MVSAIDRMPQPLARQLCRARSPGSAQPEWRGFDPDWGRAAHDVASGHGLSVRRADAISAARLGCWSFPPVRSTRIRRVRSGGVVGLISVAVRRGDATRRWLSGRRHLPAPPAWPHTSRCRRQRQWTEETSRPRLGSLA